MTLFFTKNRRRVFFLIYIFFLLKLYQAKPPSPTQIKEKKSVEEQTCVAGREFPRKDLASRCRMFFLPWGDVVACSYLKGINHSSVNVRGITHSVFALKSLVTLCVCVRICVWVWGLQGSRLRPCKWCVAALTSLQRFVAHSWMRYHFDMNHCDPSYTASPAVRFNLLHMYKCRKNLSWTFGT